MMPTNSLRLLRATEQEPTPGPALQVALASSDLACIDEHFGSATVLAVYAVRPGGAGLVSVARFGAASQDGNEGKLAAKVAAVQGCAALFCLAVGGSAIRQLLAAGVQPIKVEEGTTVAETLAWLRGVVRSPSRPWVVKALRRDAAQDSRFDAMAEEGWEG